MPMIGILDMDGLLMMWFWSDAFFLFHAVGDCGGNFSGPDSGIISSPGYPNGGLIEYITWVRITWLIPIFSVSFVFDRQISRPWQGTRIESMQLVHTQSQRLSNIDEYWILLGWRRSSRYVTTQLHFTCDRHHLWATDLFTFDIDCLYCRPRLSSSCVPFVDSTG